MPTYTVKYFPVKALGEGIRLLLSYGEVEFQDIRINDQEWPQHKHSTPFGQMPILEIDGRPYTQSTAICRYLGREFGLAGATRLEDLEIDSILDHVHDFRHNAAASHYEPDPQLKEKKYEAFAEEKLGFYLKKLDEVAASNNGHLALGKLTWVDFVFTGMYDYLEYVTRVNIAERAPNLARVNQHVLSLPAIKAWYAKAPKSIKF